MVFVFKCAFFKKIVSFKPKFSSWDRIQTGSSGGGDGNGTLKVPDDLLYSLKL